MTVPTYFAWIVIAFCALSAIGQVVLIGEPRKPITKGQAAWNVLWNCVIIVWLVLWVTR